MSNLNKEIENFSLGTVSNIIGLVQTMLKNGGRFIFSSFTKRKVNKFYGIYNSYNDA